MPEFQRRGGVDYVSTTVAATVCGVTVGTFNKWRNEENPPPVDFDTGMVPLKALGHWVREWQVVKTGRGGGGFPYLSPHLKQSSDKADSDHPETRLKKLQGDKIKMELEIKAGLYVPVEDVRAGWETIVMRVRTKLLRIPVALAPLVAGQKDEYVVQERLKDAIHEVLDELAENREERIDLPL